MATPKNTTMQQQGFEFTDKLNSDQMKEARENIKRFHARSYDDQDFLRAFMKADYEEFYETEAYKSGDTNYFGYVACCDMLGFCGGLSWWIIFLIIVAIVLCCACSVFAFFLFCWNRKNGGKDEQLVEEEDNRESTESVVEVEKGKN